MADCPFCGAGEIELQVCADADDNLFIECMRCQATGPMVGSGYTWDDRVEREEGR